LGLARLLLVGAKVGAYECVARLLCPLPLHVRHFDFAASFCHLARRWSDSHPRSYP
jgi:hypothetical protein